MGKPTWDNAQVFSSESIATKRHTRRTETSKYPEEKKETSIPQVAASEQGIAQTNILDIGVVDITKIQITL